MSNQRLKSLLSASASAIGRLGDKWATRANLGDRAKAGRSTPFIWGEQRAWAILGVGDLCKRPRTEVKRSRDQWAGGLGERATGRKGEGDSTLLASASAYLPGAGKGPLSAFRLRATRLHGRAERVCAPWANSGASLATLPGYVLSFQLAASLMFFSLAAVSLHSEPRAFSPVLSKDNHNHLCDNELWNQCFRNWIYESRLKLRRLTEVLGGYQEQPRAVGYSAGRPKSPLILRQAL
jgi:hypothetical protein